MLMHGWFGSAIRRVAFVSTLILLGCQSPPSGEPLAQGPDPSYRARSVAAHRLAQDAARPPGAATTVPVRPVVPAVATRPVVTADIENEIPDPIDEIVRIDRVLAEPPKPPAPGDRPLDRQGLERLRQRIANLVREQRVDLSLSDAIRRALQNNYNIQLNSYNPAIEATKIVEAEAQFDAVFFNSFNYNEQDRPTSSALMGTNSDTRVWQGGIRKLLSTGTRVQASYGITRTATNLSFQTLNPAYFNQFTVEFQQPLLRGFGLDYNRSQIEINRLGREISLQRFEREIRETLFNVEQAYWRLLQARRSVTVQARLLEDLQTILRALEARAQYDVYDIQLNQTRTSIERQEASFVETVNNVLKAEIALKGVMNDPILNQASDAEIIPSDLPTIEPLAIDSLGEVTAALAHRAELREARLTIEQAQIAIGMAKNQALPKLDLLFRFIIDGLGANPDQAFSQLSENDFNEYVVGLDFEWPIGNRGPEAAIRRARLQQAAAIASQRLQIEGVITQVKQVIWDLKSNYEQIAPNFRAARASFDQLKAIRAKQERRDPPALQVELSANQDLASARLQLLQSLINYNINLIDLERQKGTLLRYNNVVIRGLDDESHQKPYVPSLDSAPSAP